MWNFMFSVLNDVARLLEGFANTWPNLWQEFDSNLRTHAKQLHFTIFLKYRCFNVNLQVSNHIQKKICSSCGYPGAKIRKFGWSIKARRRKTTGTGRMRSLDIVRRLVLLLLLLFELLQSHCWGCPLPSRCWGVAEKLPCFGLQFHVET